jgi:hypothetical protein
VHNWTSTIPTVKGTPGRKKLNGGLKNTPTVKNQRQKYRTPSKNHYPDPKAHLYAAEREGTSLEPSFKTLLCSWAYTPVISDGLPHILWFSRMLESITQ